MNQESRLTRKRHHAAAQPTAVLYRLYAEAKPTELLVLRYFRGATFIPATRLWEGRTEASTVIEIIGTRDDLQCIIDLAGDIRTMNEQQSVLVTWTPMSELRVADSM